MMPYWWVEAYDATFLAEGSQAVSPMELSCVSRLAPALNTNELNALGVLLSELQNQILLGKSKVYFLDPTQHRKNASQTSKGKIFLFERALQVLAGLRLLLPNEHGGFELVPFFLSEQWLKIDNKTELQLKLQPTQMGAQLLLGYADPYLNLVRMVRGRPCISTLLGNRAPLALWRSTWLDLQGAEQAILLRLEKAMQWDFRWLRLDGFFGQSFKDLFKGIELPTKSKKTSYSTFQAQLSLLDRIGSKMSDHGMLSVDGMDHYIALSSDETAGSMLTWKMAGDRVTGQEASDYLALIAIYLSSEYDANFEEIVKVLLGNVFSEPLVKQLRSIWDEIIKIDEKEGNCVICCLNNNLPIQSSSLFMEWVIRQLPGHAIPLPETFKNSLIVKAATLSDEKTTLKHYKQFRQLFAEKSNYASDLLTTAGALLCVHSLLSSRERNNLFALSPTESQAPEVTSGNLYSVDEIAGASQKESRDYPLANLKRLAIRELERMKKTDQIGYKDLKRLYVNALSEKKKKIIKEVESRLQPQMFDEQIKHGLVKFMLENPSYWRSAPLDKSRNSSNN